MRRECQHGLPLDIRQTDGVRGREKERVDVKVDKEREYCTDHTQRTDQSGETDFTSSRASRGVLDNNNNPSSY